MSCVGDTAGSVRPEKLTSSLAVRRAPRPRSAPAARSRSRAPGAWRRPRPASRSAPSCPSASSPSADRRAPSTPVMWWKKFVRDSVALSWRLSWRPPASPSLGPRQRRRERLRRPASRVVGATSSCVGWMHRVRRQRVVRPRAVAVDRIAVASWSLTIRYCIVVLRRDRALQVLRVGAARVRDEPGRQPRRQRPQPDVAGAEQAGEERVSSSS